jgi:hypothetical protein
LISNNNRDIQGNDAFWNLLVHHMEEGFLMGCAVNDPKAGVEEEMKEGMKMFINIK